MRANGNSDARITGGRPSQFTTSVGRYDVPRACALMETAMYVSLVVDPHNSRLVSVVATCLEMRANGNSYVSLVADPHNSQLVSVAAMCRERAR